MRWRGAPVIVAAALLAACLGLAASLAWSGEGAALARSPLGRWLFPADPGIGTAVTPFSLPDRQGRPMALPPPGQAVLINYWASWCEPCRREMPLLAKFARDQGGTAVVGIALDTAESADAFLATTPVAFPILLEAPGPADSSVRLGNVRGVLPYSVLIDAQGRLQARHVGPFASRQQLEAWTAAAR